MTLFTKIIKGHIPSYKILEDDLFYAFLDISPLRKGHTLVVPKIEIDRIFDLPDAYLSAYLPFCAKVAHAIKKSVLCNRVNIITVGFEVPHCHIHLIPTNNLLDLDFKQPKLALTKEEFETVQNLIISNL